MTQKHRKFFTALEEYTEDLKVKNGKNPVLLNLNGEDISVYLGNLGLLTKEKNVVKHSLSAKNINTQRQRYKDGFKIAFIGVYKMGSNYCAWDLQRIFSSKAKNSTTMRAPKSHEKKTLNFPVIDKRKNYTSIIMPPSTLGPYLDNIEACHSITEKDTVIEALKYGMNCSPEDPPRYDYTDSGKKSNFVFRGTLVKSRDAKFRRDVMHAYGRACCICKLQFATEAAHIIPHRSQDTHQSVQNGLALCPNHHIMYDKQLFTIDSEYRILVNHDMISELHSEGLAGGLDQVEKMDGKQISLPRDREAWPSAEYLKSHNKNKNDS